MWKLKDKNIVCKIEWKIVDRAPKFTPISQTFKLCTLERFYLLCKKESYTLNKNKEFGDECLHKRFLKLSTAKWDNTSPLSSLWPGDEMSWLVWFGFVIWPLDVWPLKIVVLALHETNIVGNKWRVSDLLFQYIYIYINCNL